jgi:hypothetical protein
MVRVKTSNGTFDAHIFNITEFAIQDGMTYWFSENGADYYKKENVNPESKDEIPVIYGVVYKYIEKRFKDDMKVK